MDNDELKDAIRAILEAAGQRQSHDAVIIGGKQERSPDYLNDDVNELKNLLVAADLEGFVPLTDKRGIDILKIAKSRYVFKR